MFNYSRLAKQQPSHDSSLARVRSVQTHRIAHRVAVVCLACISLNVASAEPPASLCEDFRRLMNMSYENGLRRYQVWASSIHGGEDQYFNLDVDGDDISDEIKGGCPASIQHADSCVLLINMSSGKEISFTFGDGERFYLARYRSRIYAIVNHAGSEKNRGSRSALSIGRNGIKRICAQL